MDEMLQVLGDRERKCLKKNTLLLIDVRKEPCVRRQTREAYLRRRRAKLNVGRTLLAVGPFFFSVRSAGLLPPHKRPSKRGPLIVSSSLWANNELCEMLLQ